MAEGKPFSSFEELYDDFGYQLVLSLLQKAKSVGAMMDEKFQEEVTQLETREDEIRVKLANAKEFAYVVDDLNKEIIKRFKKKMEELVEKQANLEKKEKALVKEFSEKKSFYRAVEKDNQELCEEVEKLLLEREEKEYEKKVLKQREALVREKEDKVKLELAELQKKREKLKEKEISLMKQENSVMELQTALEDREKMLAMQEKAFMKKEKELQLKQALVDLTMFFKQKQPVGNADWKSYLDFLDSLIQKTESGSDNRPYLMKARRVAQAFGKKLDLVVRSRHVVQLDVAHDDASNPGEPLVQATGKGDDLIDAVMDVSNELKRLMLASYPHGNYPQSSASTHQLSF